MSINDHRGRRFGNNIEAMRGPDDYFSKRKKAHVHIRRRLGRNTQAQAVARQGVCISSRKLEVGRWLSRASLQGEAHFDLGEGKKFGRLPEAIDFDRHIYDALKAGTGGEAYGIVKRVEPPATYNLHGETVGLDSSTSLGFEAWTQLHLEYWPRSKESWINHMVYSLSVTPARGYIDFRSKIYEVDDHMREANAMKGATIPEEVQKVAPLKIAFEDLGIRVRRQGPHHEKVSPEELRALLVDQAALTFEEKAAKGSFEQLEGEPAGDQDEGSWMQGEQGER